MQSAQIIKINDDGGLLPKKNQRSKALLKRKLWLTQSSSSMRDWGGGPRAKREVKEKMKWKMTQWSLVIWKFNNHKKSPLIFRLQSNHCACLQSSTEEWIGRGGLRIERQLFVFATGKCAYDDDDGYDSIVIFVFNWKNVWFMNRNRRNALINLPQLVRDYTFQHS